MTSNQFEVEIKYRLALFILCNLLKDEIITKKNAHLYYHYHHFYNISFSIFSMHLFFSSLLG